MARVVCLALIQHDLQIGHSRHGSWSSHYMWQTLGWERFRQTGLLPIPGLICSFENETKQEHIQPGKKGFLPAVDSLCWLYLILPSTAIFLLLLLVWQQYRWILERSVSLHSSWFTFTHASCSLLLVPCEPIHLVCWSICSFQAMIEEDRLLNRIETLEAQLVVCAKVSC